MDAEITQLFKESGNTPGENEIRARITTIDESKGEIEITIKGVAHRCVLKALKDLYGPGINAPSVDSTDSRYLPLLMEIERGIVEFDRYHAHLTDGSVASTLNRMGINPEMNSVSDELGRHLQWNLRLLLSVNNYSRQDVIQALRKINKSVARHTRADGPRGYLDFIRQYVPQ
ncbi:MAG: hypothetical protein M1472_04335 [Planctomycetes bacterium]|nr:hypothetical protein [Planctomycetota bacterium]